MHEKKREEQEQSTKEEQELGKETKEKVKERGIGKLAVSGGTS